MRIRVYNATDRRFTLPRAFILEGVPGLAKTLMVSPLASLLNLTFRRIQFTSDLMPADITGTDILEEDRTTGKRVCRFVKGPLFGNMILD